MDTSTRTFFVAGVQFRPRATLDLVSGYLMNPEGPQGGEAIIINLLGEPSNRYDKYAVKVILPWDGNNFHIGYIPKPINVGVWSLRDEGYKPVARLVEFNPHADPWMMFKVEVSFTKQDTKQ